MIRAHVAARGGSFVQVFPRDLATARVTQDVRTGGRSSDSWALPGGTGVFYWPSLPELALSAVTGRGDR